MMAQVSLGGTPTSHVRCTRCNRPLSNPQSVERRYGPICWGKIQHAAEEWYKDMPRTISDSALAAAEIEKLFKAVEESEATCTCGLLLAEGDIHSFDHDGGYDLKGFGHKQWVFITCPKCKYDTAAWKVLRRETERDYV